jgi:hypothetical protein
MTGRRGLAALTAAERDAWSSAVAAYADGLSRKDPVDDEPFAKMIGELARAGDAPTLGRAAVDADARAILERAAPIYRKAWWPAHRAGNEAYAAALTKLVERYGEGIRDFLTAKYELPWPATGYPVHLAAYSVWAGAYSTYGNLLVVATNDGSGMHGLAGLETVFHEAMHQWDDAVATALDAQARKLGTQVPDGLSHSLIFYTAGEAVRRAAPEHVPFGEASGRWTRLAAVRAALDGAWKPYLDGGGASTRDNAFGGVIARIATLAPAPPPTPVGPAASAAPSERPTTASPLFTFETDELWLNRHHFLWTLGRTEAAIADNSRQSTFTAAAEAERALPSLSADERATWAEAVRAYATGLSLKAALAEPMPSTRRCISGTGKRSTRCAPRRRTRPFPAISRTH